MRQLFPGDIANVTRSHYVIDPYTWLAINHRPPMPGGLFKLYETISLPEDEGLVLKNPDARLAMCLREDSNSGWQVKSQRQHKNYSF